MNRSIVPSDGDASSGMEGPLHCGWSHVLHALTPSHRAPMIFDVGPACRCRCQGLPSRSCRCHAAATPLIIVSKPILIAVQAMAPSGHTVTAATSALCKVVAWRKQGLLDKPSLEGCRPQVLHQADWLAYKLHGEEFSYYM